MCKHSSRGRGRREGGGVLMGCQHLEFVPLCSCLALLYAFIFLSLLSSGASTTEKTQTRRSQHEPQLDMSEDQFCTELTNRVVTLDPSADSSSEKGEKTAFVCRNFAYEFSTDLFRLIWFRGNNGFCSIETLSDWYTHCLMSSGSRKLDSKITPPISTNFKLSDRTTNRSKSSTRYVDFLFLIEQPRSIDVNRSRHLVNALRNLAKAVRTSAFNIDAHFAFVLYPLDGGPFSRISNFGPSVSDVEQFLEIGVSVDHEQTNRAKDVRLLQYTSVKESLNHVSKLLKLVDGEKVKVHSQDRNASLTLSHRDYADLHILSFLDLSSKSSSSQSQNSGITRLIDTAKESIDDKITNILDDMQLSSVSEHPTSFHFFFNSFNSAARTYLGDPQHSIRYSDCSHFNKAMSLKALLSSTNKDQADSLQAHMLSQGVEMQVHSWNDLLKKDCLCGVTPVLSTPGGLHNRFTNACLEDAGGYQSRSGYYCSPLHGWVRREAKKSKSVLFEGKAPLSDQFMASHADLLKPVSTEASANDTADSVRLAVVQLTVNKDLDGNKQSRFKPVIEGRPRVLQWSPDKPFIEKMISKRKPTVLKNTVVHTWPALKKWDLSYLEKNMDTDILPSVKCTNTFVTFDPDQRTPLKLNISLPFAAVNMTKESFFECIQNDASNPICSDGYGGHYYFGRVPDTLKADVMPDNLLYHTEKDYKAKKQFMWISSAGMITHTHFDQDYNFFVQLVGKKRFTLWSPEQRELMYVYPRVHPMWHKSRVNYQAVDLEKFPAFAQAKGKQIELGPGDMLFVPPYTWHYVETLTPSVSLSTWSHDYKLYDHMNSIYRHDHKFDLLEDSRGE